MSLKQITRTCLLLGMMAAQHAGAFTLWGPLEAWQTSDLDYSNPAGSPRYYYHNVEISLDDRENGGPKNFGEGSRLTTPVITYGYDATFLEYFGTSGVAAVDSAFAVLNALPSASSANLANYLTEGVEQINYSAQAVELFDLKSTVLFLMAEHMGLMGETHVWDLAYRQPYATTPPNPCALDYLVINRNYAPGTYNPSAYVNGRQYTYYIWDGCTIPVAVGDAIELPLDATGPRYTAVATGGNLEYGGYYLNFSRDDVGGLQYLYRGGNYAYQNLDSDSVAEPFQNISTIYNPVGTNPIVEPAGISNFAGLFGGVEKITYVKVNYDSYLNPGFTPISYNYSIPFVTNGILTRMRVRRTITAPDILFTAADLVVNATPVNDAVLSRTGTFVQTTYASPGGGVTPSTINPTELIVLNNVGPIYWNINPYFIDNQNNFTYPIFNWGSFNGSTAAPIVYPQGSSLADLELQVVQGSGAAVPTNTWNPVLVVNTNATVTGAPPPATTMRVH